MHGVANIPDNWKIHFVAISNRQNELQKARFLFLLLDGSSNAGNVDGNVLTMWMKNMRSWSDLIEPEVIKKSAQGTATSQFLSVFDMTQYHSKEVIFLAN